MDYERRCPKACSTCYFHRDITGRTPHGEYEDKYGHCDNDYGWCNYVNVWCANDAPCGAWQEDY